MSASDQPGVYGLVRPLNYIEAMFRWRISIFGKTPARSLGIITAPDDEAAARTKASEYFHIEPALQFRVVAARIAKKPALLCAQS
jgi:hypothetical protein